jgi:CcmD family protein
MKDIYYVVAAYSIIWIILFLYILFIDRRLANLEKGVKHLEEVVKGKN